MIAFIAATLILTSPDGLTVGERVAFDARTQAGSVVRASSLSGKPAVVLLWGPWSNGSSRALVELSTLSASDKRARFVSLASWDEPDNVSKFLATVRGVTLDIWLDPAGKNPSESIAVKAFRTRRFPSVYVVDAQQRVVGSFLGYKPTDDVKSLITKAIGP